MKRLIAITACLFVIIAAAASAWASCKRESFQANSAASAHTHDHHADSHHSHDGPTVIHCPTLDAFLLTASLSQSKPHHQIQRLTIADVPELADQFGACPLYRSLHGPPGYSRFSNTPPYLVLSVLRI